MSLFSYGGFVGDRDALWFEQPCNSFRYIFDVGEQYLLVGFCSFICQLVRPVHASYEVYWAGVSSKHLEKVMFFHFLQFHYATMHFCSVEQCDIL